MSDILTQPGTRLALITPSNATEVNCRALYVGSTGNVSIIARDDTAEVTIPNVPAGTILPIWCRIIRSTGTTASNLVGIF